VRHGSRLPDVAEIVYTGMLVGALAIAGVAGVIVLVSMFRSQG